MSAFSQDIGFSAVGGIAGSGIAGGAGGGRGGGNVNLGGVSSRPTPRPAGFSGAPTRGPAPVGRAAGRNNIAPFRSPPRGPAPVGRSVGRNNIAPFRAPNRSPAPVRPPAPTNSPPPRAAAPQPAPPRQLPRPFRRIPVGGRGGGIPWPFARERGVTLGGQSAGRGASGTYENQVPFGALANGPKTDVGAPGTVAEGSVAGVIYTLSGSYEQFAGWGPTGPVYSQVNFDGLVSGTPRLLGPVTKQRISSAGSISDLYTAADGQTASVPVESQFSDGTLSSRNGSGSLVRVDGGQDPVIGTVAPTYAPNPFRRSRPLLPRPTTLPSSEPSPWPHRPSEPAPGQQPLPYINPTTPGFSPAPPGIAPGVTPTLPPPGTQTGTPSSPSRLGTGVGGSSPSVIDRQPTFDFPFTLPPGIPWPVITPVTVLNPPRLDPGTQIQVTPTRVNQLRPQEPRTLCRYEQARVMDIQSKATDTQQRSSNPVSGFPGLYGLAIESRLKTGEIFDNTQEIKRRIRPEDFPIIVPDQIAKANPVPRSIESLAELGVWIVEQLDGVVGKWPMEVPVPGISQALAVPNMSEAIAEIFGMMISQQVTAAQILNTSSRTLAQAGSATQQAALANMIAKANAEFLGYEGRPTAVDMPLTYSPGKEPGEGLLEESTAKIKGWSNTDNTDLKQILSDLMHAAQIIKAVYWRKLDARGDFQSQIDEQIEGKSEWLNELGSRPSAQQENDWEQYLKDVEAGFRSRTADNTPYGRTPDEGPAVRDVTPPPEAD